MKTCDGYEDGWTEYEFEEGDGEADCVVCDTDFAPGDRYWFDGDQKLCPDCFEAGEGEDDA